VRLLTLLNLILAKASPRRGVRRRLSPRGNVEPLTRELRERITS